MKVALIGNVGSVEKVKENINSAIENAKTLGRDAAGRTFHVVQAAGSKTCSLFAGIIDVVSRVFGDADAMQQAVKLTVWSIMAKAIYVSGKVGEVGSKVCGSLNKVDEFIDFTAIFRDASYLINGKYKTDIAEGHKFSFLGKLSLLAADITGSALWLVEVGALNLGKAAAAIGRLPVFSLVTKISLLTFTRVAVTFGFGFLAAHAITRIAQNDCVNQNLLFLGQATAEIALKVFVLAGLTNPVVHVSLGILAASFALSSFAYGQYFPGGSTDAVEVEQVKELAQVV